MSPLRKGSSTQLCPNAPALSPIQGSPSKSGLADPADTAVMQWSSNQGKCPTFQTVLHMSWPNVCRTIGFRPKDVEPIIFPLIYISSGSTLVEHLAHNPKFKGFESHHWTW